MSSLPHHQYGSSPIHVIKHHIKHPACRVPVDNAKLITSLLNRSMSSASLRSIGPCVPANTDINPGCCTAHVSTWPIRNNKKKNAVSVGPCCVGQLEVNTIHSFGLQPPHHESSHNMMLSRTSVPTASLDAASCITNAGDDHVQSQPASDTHHYRDTIIADRWREYHGCHGWQGLLEPLDQGLRQEIIKYGDLAQLTYDVFDCESKRCIHEEATLLEADSRLSDHGYRVTKYIYSKPEVHLLPRWLRKWRHKEEDHDEDGCWAGFIAVMEDEEQIRRVGRRDIVVAWRGTATSQEWLEDMDEALFEPPLPADSAPGIRAHDGGGGTHCDHVGVEHGFWSLYASGRHSAREQVTDEIRRLLSLYAGCSSSSSSEQHELSITLTGHSLGGALAILSAYDLAASGLNSSGAAGAAAAPISVVSFAAPRLGNEAFRSRLHDDLKVNVLRVVNAHDLVPKVPGILVHDEFDEDGGGGGGGGERRSRGPPSGTHESGPEGLTWHSAVVGILLRAAQHSSSYVHVGVPLHLDNCRSPLLKPRASLVDAHNLEVYLHLLDVYRSEHEPFVGHIISDINSSLDFLSRNIALVNKTSALLLDDLRIPPYWWTPNRGRRRRCANNTN